MARARSALFARSKRHARVFASGSETLIEGFPQHLTLPKVEVKKTITLEEMVENLSKARNLGDEAFI
jgi:hypothetical protein